MADRARVEHLPSEERARSEFRETLRPLVMLYGMKLDTPDWFLWHAALRDIPIRLISLAVNEVATRGSRFPPRPGDIRESAERARKALVAANPWEMCGACRNDHGWTTVIDGDGTARLKRCECFAAHQASITAMGIPSRPLLSAVTFDEEFGS